MAELISVSPDNSLDDLSREFTHWRKTRQHRSAIPESLWLKALDITKSYPKSKVAQKLKLNYSELKRRLDLFHSPDCPPSPAFVELGFQGAKQDNQQSSPNCHLEVETVYGNRFRCIVHGDIPPDLLAFCRSLLERR